MMQELHETQDTAKKRIAAALGVFDGVHLGHRRVLEHTLAHGECHVVTFAADSMPQKRGKPVRYIYHDEQKRRLLTSCGAKAVYALPYTELADMDGETFCKQILREHLQVDSVIVGAHFRFGKDAANTVSDLKRFGQKLGFSVEVVRQLRDTSNVPVSSSQIRFLIESGQIQAANRLLGSPYRILSHVVTGQQLGSSVLGIPTANQVFESWQCIPHRGVYASFAEINDIWVPAITNIGVRPTVTGGDAQPIAETHLIDWDGELVGKLLPVTLCRFIRPEQTFDSLESLAMQIRRDIRTRMRFLPADGITADA